jgi:hypothetical protein
MKDRVEAGLEATASLIHYGVKGMKWGVRRNRSSRVSVAAKGKKLKTSGGVGRKPSEDAKRAAIIGQISKKSGIHALTNEQLQMYNNRLNLEVNARRLDYQQKGRGSKFVEDLLRKTGEQTSNKVAQEVASRQVKKLLVSSAVAAA